MVQSHVPFVMTNLRNFLILTILLPVIFLSVLVLIVYIVELLANKSMDIFMYSGTSEERTLLSFLWRLSLSRRLMKYFNFITFYMKGWNISNVVKVVDELVCK